MKLVAVAAEIAAAVRVLARHRLGAILLVEPAVSVEGGVVIDARVKRELLIALTMPESLNRLHRGVTLIRGCRIERAGVPLAWTDLVERAAELAVGVAFAVDEDTGEICLLDRTGRVEVVDGTALAEVLREHALELRRR